MKKKRTRIVLVIAVLVAITAISCVTINMPGANGAQPTPQPSPQPSQSQTSQASTPGFVNGRRITAEMTDEQILAAFDIDIRSAGSKVSKGPDGYSTSYSVGEQMVSITRSVVSGVYVHATGPIKGEWELGGGI